MCSRSSSSTRGTVVMRLHSRARSSLNSKPSSSSVVLTSVESCLPLDAVTMAQSTGTYYRRLSPSAASSRPVPVYIHLCRRAAHPNMDVAAGVGPHVIAGVHSSRGLHSHASPPVAPQGP